MPFYVSPEQAMKDKADYARKGIARGRSGVVIQYDGGILFVAPNPSSALHKISEIYDRIAFAAVGRYNEFENLRKAGVRYADYTGYQYDRSDVTARGLANWYAQILGQFFTESNKPFEVELVVAEVGESPASTRSTGSRSTARWPRSMASWPWAARPIRWRPCSRTTTRTTSRSSGRWEPRSPAWPARATARARRRTELSASQLEVGILARDRVHRTFRRLTGARLEVLLAEAAGGEGSGPASPAAGADEPQPGEAASPDEGVTPRHSPRTAQRPGAATPDPASAGRRANDCRSRAMAGR